MEPNYSVLIFSKYSANCKKVFDLVNSCGVDFDRVLGNKLQLLCIDNDKVRKRIKENKQIDVSSVPCILSIFPNGGVEKYDGLHAFAWIENLLSKYAPPPPPPPPPLPPQQPVYNPPVPVQQQEEVQVVRKQKAPVKIPKRMKPVVVDEEDQPMGTSIDDIPMEDEENEEEESGQGGNDRHRNLPQPRRIRQDEDKFIEDEELFSGDVVDNRQEPRNVVRKTSDKKKAEGGVRAKADELARGREDMEREFGTQNKRPLDGRRP